MAIRKRFLIDVGRFPKRFEAEGLEVEIEFGRSAPFRILIVIEGEKLTLGLAEIGRQFGKPLGGVVFAAGPGQPKKEFMPIIGKGRSVVHDDLAVHLHPMGIVEGADIRIGVRRLDRKRRHVRTGGGDDQKRGPAETFIRIWMERGPFDAFSLNRVHQDTFLG